MHRMKRVQGTCFFGAGLCQIQRCMFVYSHMLMHMLWCLSNRAMGLSETAEFKTGEPLYRWTGYDRAEKAGRHRGVKQPQPTPAAQCER